MPESKMPMGARFIGIRKGTVTLPPTPPGHGLQLEVARESPQVGRDVGLEARRTDD